MNQTITLTISPKGGTKVETSGFTGQSCQDASKFIETALGRKTTEQFKPEYFLDEKTNLQHKEKVQC